MMHLLLSLILVACLLMLVHTYIGYPVWMLSKKADDRKWITDETPDVTVLLAVFNEIDIIRRKMESMVSYDYPSEKFTILIGSDASDDGTNEVLKSFADQYPCIQLHLFTNRRGKAEVMEDLISRVRTEIVVFTDADTLFRTDTVRKLVAPFTDPKIGGVQGNIKSIRLDRSDALEQESVFNDIEMKIKMAQSSNGMVIGAIGSIFAMRKSLYEHVPYGIIVDDFFLFMTILKKGFQTIFAVDSVSDLYVSGDVKLQFKRKMRIGSGNFMAFGIFGDMALPWNGAIGFHYFSYKVLRWFGPFLMVISYLSVCGLSFFDTRYLLLAALGTFIFLTVPIDSLLRKMGIQFKVLRYIAHFVLMNIAMLAGFFRYHFRGNSAAWNNPKKVDQA